MMFSDQVINFLLNYGTLAAAIVILAACIAVLIVKRRTLPQGARIGLIVITVICVLYLVFVLWAVIGFGNGHPGADPVPIGD